MPLRRYIFPKSYRIVPETMSIPIVDSRMPKQVQMIPSNGLSPTSQLMDVMATNIIMDISEGPKFKPKLARAGPMNTRMIMPMVPPMQEDRFAAISAWPGRPCRVRG